MQYAKSTRMHYYIWSDFAVCMPACFFGDSDPQPSAWWKIFHIDLCHNVQCKYGCLPNCVLLPCTPNFMLTLRRIGL